MGGAAPTGTDSEPPVDGASESAQPDGGTKEPDEAVTPEASDMAEPTMDPVKTAATCKNAVAGLGSGDLSALDSLDAAKRAHLLSGQLGKDALTCLASANDDASYCNQLSEQMKTNCLEHRAHVHEIKGLPKEEVKPYVIHAGCVLDTPKEDCDKVKGAMVAGKAALCKDLSSALLRQFCIAVVSNDASKCTDIPENKPRALCAAFVTGDRSRCPKDSADCRNMIALFAAVEKDGVSNVDGIDPWAAAAAKGNAACAPLLADLERVCIEGE